MYIYLYIMYTYFNLFNCNTGSNFRLLLYSSIASFVLIGKYPPCSTMLRKERTWIAYRLFPFLQNVYFSQKGPFRSQYSLCS